MGEGLFGNLFTCQTCLRLLQCPHHGMSLQGSRSDRWRVGSLRGLVQVRGRGNLSLYNFLLSVQSYGL